MALQPLIFWFLIGSISLTQLVLVQSITIRICPRRTLNFVSMSEDNIIVSPHFKKQSILNNRGLHKVN